MGPLNSRAYGTQISVHQKKSEARQEAAGILENTFSQKVLNVADIEIIKKNVEDLQINLIENNGIISHSTFVEYAKRLEGMGFSGDQAFKLLDNIVFMASHQNHKFDETRIYFVKRGFKDNEFIQNHFLYTETIKQFIQDIEDISSNEEGLICQIQNGQIPDHSSQFPSLIQALLHVYVAQAYYQNENKIADANEQLKKALEKIKLFIEVTPEEKINNPDILYIIKTCSELISDSKSKIEKINKSLQEKQLLLENTINIKEKNPYKEDTIFLHEKLNKLTPMFKEVTSIFDTVTQIYTNKFIRHNFPITDFDSTQEFKVDIDKNVASLKNNLTNVGKKFYEYFNDPNIKIKLQRRLQFKYEAKSKSGSTCISDALIFENIFEKLFGISYTEFSVLTRGGMSCKFTNPDGSSNRQTIIPQAVPNKQYEPITELRDNSQFKMYQEFFHENHPNLKFCISIKGTKTISSAGQQHDRNIFKKANQHGHLGINHNELVLEVIDTTTNTVISTYPIDTVGSYQINKDDDGFEAATKNAADLIEAIVKSRETALNRKMSDDVIVFDGKPLKSIPFITNDSKIFDNHTKVMHEAIKNSNIKPFNYVPVLGNSYFELSFNIPESNQDFKNIITFLGSKINGHPENAKLPPLLKALESILNYKESELNSKEYNLDISNFKSMGKFIAITAIHTILSGNFLQDILEILGCMSAKDRVMALISAIITITMLNHIKGNLNFIDLATGKLKPDSLTFEDIAFLKDFIGCDILHNILSYLGIGILNNKNLYLFAYIFEDIPELYTLFNLKETLAATAA